MKLLNLEKKRKDGENGGGQRRERDWNGWSNGRRDEIKVKKFEKEEKTELCRKKMSPPLPQIHNQACSGWSLIFKDVSRIPLTYFDSRIKSRNLVIYFCSYFPHRQLHFKQKTVRV
jgi:hypothetical protein